MSPDVLVGPGDDSAVVRFGKQHLVVSVDAQLEGVHFRLPWLSPVALGRRSYHVSVSDLAAMGARPRWLVVHYTVPPGFPVASLHAIQRGLVDEAKVFGSVLIGGNLSRGRQLGIVITVFGTQSSHPVTRAGARPGDCLFVSGTLGDAASAVRAWKRGKQPSAPLQRRFARPTARLALGQRLARRGLATAMIDVSDGLVQDLGHLCRASKVGAVVNSTSLPLSAAYQRANHGDPKLALSGGEDYELLCAIPESKVKQVRQLVRGVGCDMTLIGRFTSGRRVRVVGATNPGGTGFDHFQF